ncbi:zinc finger protein 658B-like [Stegodyphus dumicola]|uniref:zinc finger protein 658B-like n=1 Tax=Stegodyphus dumicola TaxID=202533 RepID=UPI0015A8F031|nr:zinc finger protein 658B-like [Stegodyphus dumicola]
MSKKRYECNICGKAFPFNYLLIRHKRIHAYDKLLVSKDISQQQTSVKSDEFVARLKSFINLEGSSNRCLAREMRNHKNVIYAGKHLHTRGHLNGHLCVANNESNVSENASKQHMAEKPNESGASLKSFTYPEDLQQHVSVQRNEEPQECNICAKTFAHQGHSNGHLCVANKESDVSQNASKHFEMVETKWLEKLMNLLHV